MPTPDPRASVEAAERDLFEFLEFKPGCGVQVEAERNLFTTIAYVFENVVFEVYLEWKEPSVDLRVCLPIDGRPPRPWRVHEGRRVRVYYYEALRYGDDDLKSESAMVSKRIQDLNPARNKRKRGSMEEGPQRQDQLERMIQESHIYAESLRRTVDKLPPYYDKIFGPHPTAGGLTRRPG
jgi:hypothetical protein